MKAAWELIDTDMIIKSFKKCGISNSMDGEEDDLLYHDYLESDSDAETGLTDDETEDVYEISESSDKFIQELFESDDDEEEFLGF